MFKQLIIITLVIGCMACQKQEQVRLDSISLMEQQKFLVVMDKHLNAVSSRDLESLKSTLSPSGEMQLILPSSEVFYNTDSFIKYHKDWFAIPDWTFETKILNKKIGKQLGMVIVEIIYREPMRDGKPYFNRMIVSYVLEKIKNQWYVIKDHASSINKSTDSD